MSLWGTFFGVAFALTAWAGIPLVNACGPSALFLVHGIVMGVTGITLAGLLPAQQKTAFRHSGKFHRLDFGSFARRHHHVYTSPFIAAPAFGWLFYTATFVALLTVLPTLMPAQERSLVASVMPLAAIIVSMTLGVALQRIMQAVHVVALGFCTAILVASLFLFLPAQPWMAISLMAAMGLVQGASFVAVPQLNTNPIDQALANGGMAQTGNLGNLIGTPLLLSVLNHAGDTWMILTVIGLFTLGLIAHLLSARARSSLAVTAAA
jgi:predicted MFS family arabinose efflux permease